MKNIVKLIKILSFVGAIFLSSCETTELDLTENPNALTPSQANPDFFMNSIQEDFARFVENFGRVGAEVTRIDYMFGRDYQNAYSPASFDNEWQSAYQGMMEDISKMDDLAIEAGFTKHVGMGQVFKAYILMTLVDFFGDVPYSEALQGSDNLNPAADSGESIYNEVFILLDQAIANFENEAAPNPSIDFYYNKNWSKWIKAANTLKLKALITTRLVDQGAASQFMNIVNSGDYISSNSDDFQFSWGTNEVQPDTRHPRYSASYTATGGGDYMSVSFMSTLLNTSDPRRFYYFYRQNELTPGFGAPANQETLDCSLEVPPLHYEGFPFCGLQEGYWGRDHGNTDGIPPDGFLRTLVGVYPAGGAFDAGEFEPLKNGGGNGGNGITPVMLASWTDFMIAELKMVAGDAAGAKDAMLSGLSKSVTKVTSFAVNPDPREAQNIEDHYNSISDAFDAADDKMEAIATQYFISLYGNGIDAYNFYRRTGYPTKLQPNLELNPGGFIRSFFYPANYANTNSNATQKDNVLGQVFWDTNPASPAFPIAN